MPFERNVCAAHDGLPHVVEAVDHVPVVVVRDGVVGFEARVGLHDGEEAVELVGHGGGEDGLVGPVDGPGEVVVFVGFIDPDEAHAFGHEGVPLIEDGVGKEFRRVHGRVGGVGVELDDLLGNWGERWC